MNEIAKSLSSILKRSIKVDLFFVCAIHFHAFWNIISHGHERIPWSSNYFWRQSQNNGGLQSVVSRRGWFSASWKKPLQVSFLAAYLFPYCEVESNRTKAIMLSTGSVDVLLFTCFPLRAKQARVCEINKKKTSQRMSERNTFCVPFTCATQIRWIKRSSQQRLVSMMNIPAST